MDFSQVFRNSERESCVYLLGHLPVRDAVKIRIVSDMFAAQNKLKLPKSCFAIEFDRTN